MRGTAMVATLSILATWSSSADAGGVVYREPCGYYGCQPICRPHGGPFGPSAPITGGLSDINTMGEVRPWVRIGRRTGRADNSGDIDTGGGACCCFCHSGDSGDGRFIADSFSRTPPSPGSSPDAAGSSP